MLRKLNLVLFIFLLTHAKILSQGKWASVRDSLLSINYHPYTGSWGQYANSIGGSKRNALFIYCCDRATWWGEKDSIALGQGQWDCDSISFLSLNNTCEPDTSISRLHAVRVLQLNGGSYYPSFLTDFDSLEYIIDFSFESKTSGWRDANPPKCGNVKGLFVKYVFNDFHYRCTEIEELAIQLNGRMPSLSTFSRLKFLYVDGGNYSSLVSEILECPSLTYLELYHDVQKRYDMESLIGLVRHPNLKQIDYYIPAGYCLLNHEGMRRMSEVRRILANSGIKVRFFWEVFEKHEWKYRLIEF